MKHLITQSLDGEPGAILSDCEQYRYRLWREWDRRQPALGFIMLNPSTANHQVSDPTITRRLQRALAGRYGRLEVVNLFPLRSTDPDGLPSHLASLGREDTSNCSITDAMATRLSWLLNAARFLVAKLSLLYELPTSDSATRSTGCTTPPIARPHSTGFCPS